MGTRYRYVTEDGGPPNGGAPPGAPPNANPFAPTFSPAPPPSYLCSTMAPSAPPSYICSTSAPLAPPSYMCFPCPAPTRPPPQFYPFSPAGSTFVPPQGPTFVSPQGPTFVPPQTCYGSPPPPPPSFAPPQYSSPPPQPPPAPPRSVPVPILVPTPPPCDSQPPPGVRVKGKIATFPESNNGYIFPKSNCVVHLVKGNTKPWQFQGLTPAFNAYFAPTSMRMMEFIEQVGAIKRAPPGTPQQAIGLCEIVEGGNGTWIRGTSFLLGDDSVKLNTTLHQAGWIDDRGEAGRLKPVWVVCVP